MSTNPVCPNCGHTDYNLSSIERRSKLRVTRAGLLLLSTGTLLSLSFLLRLVVDPSAPIFSLDVLSPLFLSALGGLLSAVGVVFMIPGREALGPTHSNRVISSVALFIAGNIVSFGTSFQFTSALSQAHWQPATQGGLVLSFFTLLIGNLAGIAVSGLGYVLLTSALQERIGLILLWTGYICGLAIGVATIDLVGPQVPGAIQQFLAGTNYSIPVYNLESQVANYTALEVLPRITFAIAYLLAWSKIRPREHASQ